MRPKRLSGNLSAVLNVVVSALLLALFFSCHKSNSVNAATDVPIPLQVIPAYFNTFVITGGDSLWATGNDISSMFGDGGTGVKPSFTFLMAGVKAVSARLRSALVLKKDGTAWACGVNNFGQLGNGTTTSTTNFVQIMTDVIAITNGYWDTYLLRSDNSLWAAGENLYGELGNGSQSQQSIPLKVMTGVKGIYGGDYCLVVLKNDNTLWGCGLTIWDYAAFTSHPQNLTTTLVPLLTDVKYAAAGPGACLAIKSDNSLWTVGSNAYGQLGDGTTITKSSFVKVMDGVAQASFGIDHLVILKTDHTVWACGANEYGELGDGKGDNSGNVAFYQTTPEQIMTDAVSVQAGYCTSFIVKSDNSIWTCGLNIDGQLGDGTTTNRNTLEKLPSKF